MDGNLKLDRQCTYNVTEGHLCSHCWSGKEISITYNEHVSVALVLQQAMHMRHIVICGLLSSPSFFHTVYTAWFKNKLNIKFVSIFCTTFVWNIFHSQKNWVTFGQNCMLFCMYSTGCYWDILMEIEFSRQFLKNPQLSTFMKICQVGAELCHVGRWTDMMKLILAFHNLANVPDDENLG